MRNRVIKAEFWSDEIIGSCSCVAQLLFIGSWNFADDSGVCRANIIYLRNNIFPYSSLTIKQIEEALLQLKTKKLIYSCNAEGGRLKGVIGGFKYAISRCLAGLKAYFVPQTKTQKEQK